MRDDVIAFKRVEVRETELLIIRGARIHGRLVRVQADGVLGSAPHLVDGRRPMLGRHQLLVGTGQRRIEIRHAQAGQTHIFKIGGAATVSGREHQAGSGVLLDGTDIRHRVLVNLQPRHTRGVGEGFGQHIDHGAVGHVRGTIRVDLLRGLCIACGHGLHGLFAVIGRLVHDFRIELTHEGDDRAVALRIVDGIPHGRRVSHASGQAVCP